MLGGLFWFSFCYYFDGSHSGCSTGRCKRWEKRLRRYMPALEVPDGVLVARSVGLMARVRGGPFSVVTLGGPFPTGFVLIIDRLVAFWAFYEAICSPRKKMGRLQAAVGTSICGNWRDGAGMRPRLVFRSAYRVVFYGRSVLVLRRWAAFWMARCTI